MKPHFYSIKNKLLMDWQKIDLTIIKTNHLAINSQQFTGKLPNINLKTRPKAAIIREKGSNSEREMANAMYLAGFDVKGCSHDRFNFGT